MRYKIFVIGLDIVFNNDQKYDAEGIKVLEMQTIYSCCEGPNSINAFHNFTSLVKNKYKGVQFQIPELGKTEKEYAEYARDISRKHQEILEDPDLDESSSINPNEALVNLGLESFSRGKWLFYSFCNQHPELKDFIPETKIASLAGLKSYNLEELKRTPLFKPADASEGLGVRLISSSEMKNFEIFKKTLNDCSITDSLVLKNFYPFVLQEYLGDTIEVTRIYALIVVDTSLDQYFIHVDSKNSFRLEKIDKDKNDFRTNSNKTSYRQTISEDEKKQVVGFLKKFFHRLYTTYDFVNYRYWEILAKQYISGHKVLTEPQRLLLFSQFSLAVSQLQRFTNTKICDHQCLLLIEFIRYLSKSGDAKRYAECINVAVKNAFSNLCFYNFLPFSDQPYLLAKVLWLFGSILESTTPEKKSFMNIELLPLPTLTPAPSKYKSKYKYFLDFLSGGERKNYAIASKRSLSQVKTFSCN